MATIRLEDATHQLAELVDQLRPGEPLVIPRGDRTVARLSAEPLTERPRRKAGSAKGVLVILSEDDDYLRDFEEYM